MRGKLPERVTEQIDMVEQVEARPSDQSAQFKLINSLIDEPARQHIILMAEIDLQMRIDDFFGVPYETGTEGRGWTTGSMSGKNLCEKLNGTGLIELGNKGAAIQLSKAGRDFAKWLTDSGLKATFLTTPLGSWGKPFRPEGMPPSFLLTSQPMTPSTEPETASASLGTAVGSESTVHPDPGESAK